MRIEAIEEPLMREIRYLDKLVDEQAKGRAMGNLIESVLAQARAEPKGSGGTSG